MPPKKKEDPMPKLDQDETTQLENLNLKVEHEQIFKRMEMLGDENKKLTRKYRQKEKEVDELTDLLQDERGRAMTDRNEAALDKQLLESKNKDLNNKLAEQEARFLKELEDQKKKASDEYRALDDQYTGLL